MKLVLIGVQGAGKSTHGNVLAEAYNVPYLSSGHIFREMTKEKTAVGRLLKETLNSGLLVSDEMTLDVIREYLAKPEYVNGYILDGFPRTVPQAEAYADVADKVIFLQISDKEALWRIAGRGCSDRQDETLQAVRKRIELFHEKTAPVVDYYRERGILIEVDADKSIDEVYADIVEAIEK